MKSKIKKNWKWANKNMLNKAMHRTRLTQNKKAKHISNANSKTRRGERKSDKITWSLFPSIPWKNLSVFQTLDPAVRGKNWNRSSLKRIWGLWVNLQEEQRMMETHFGFPMRSYCCSIKWLTIYSNLVLYVQLLHSDGKDAASSL